MSVNQSILSIIKSNQGLFCYQFYFFLTDKEKVKIHSNPDHPNTFIWHYKDMLAFYGHKATLEQLLKEYREKLDDSTRYLILFQNHQISSIQQNFSDFDFIEDSVPHNDGINRLQIMAMNKADFLPKRQLKSGKRIKAEIAEQFDPDLAEYAKTGVVYGIIENAKLMSVCPVPYIYKGFNYSFAILHNIYTHEAKRKKGYATGSVRSALNYLFTRKIIKNVYVLIDEQNVGKKMLEKIGFESTGGEWLGTYCFLK